jgi:hypothetical protein
MVLRSIEKIAKEKQKFNQRKERREVPREERRKEERRRQHAIFDTQSHV